MDITIHYDGEVRKLGYVDDLLLDLALKEIKIGKDGIEIMINAVKDSIELIPFEEIYKKHPELKKFQEMKLPGHDIELILAFTRGLALQEDVNYWGTNPNTGKPYEGRYKPYNALNDMFIKRETLQNIIKKHRLVFIKFS